LRTLVAAFSLVLLTSCGLPRDPEGTLQRVRGGTMRVGVIAHEPWTVPGAGSPSGIEVDLVTQFAEEIDAEIEWFEGSEAELFGALEVRELDLVIGGLTSTTPWLQKAAITHPYFTTYVTVAVPHAFGDPSSIDIAGEEVAAEAGRAILGLLRKTDARAVAVEDLGTWDGAAAIEGYLIDDLDLIDTGVRLEETDHVMATPLGENAWLTTLEKFLLRQYDEIEAALEEVRQ
jgi:polar amino acid transport system substrate-binding protein